MRRKIIVILLLVVLLLSNSTMVAKAETAQTDDEQINIDKMLDELDLTNLSALFNGLSDEQKAVFGQDILDFIRAIANGKDALKTESFLQYLLSVTGSSTLSVAPVLLSVIAVVVLINLIGGIRGSSASSQIDSVLNFASVLLCSGIVFVQAFSLISKCAQVVGNIKTQMEVIFPLLFTLMTALGASGSIAIYQPAVATLTISITELLVMFVIPLIIIITVFSAVGRMSSVIKLNGLVKFFTSLAKWVMYSSFFVFMALLSLKGVTASVYDNMSVRTAKFALSKYVPVIGGYLSEGFNLVLAGTVLIKNAIGFSAIVLMLVSVIPTLLSIILLVLTLKLSSGICETLGNERMAGVLSSVSGSISLLVSVLLGVVFLYFVFVLLLILSGNLVL